jgi:hypothetical protein
MNAIFHNKHVLDLFMYSVHFYNEVLKTIILNINDLGVRLQQLIDLHRVPWKRPATSFNKLIFLLSICDCIRTRSCYKSNKNQCFFTPDNSCKKDNYRWGNLLNAKLYKTTLLYKLHLVIQRVEFVIHLIQFITVLYQFLDFAELQRSKLL